MTRRVARSVRQPSFLYLNMRTTYEVQPRKNEDGA